MENPNSQKTNNAGCESLVSIVDIEYAAKTCAESQSDPLEEFPALKGFAQAACTALVFELIQGGAPAFFADHVAKRAYDLATVMGLATHRGIWNAVLPDEESAT